MRLTAPGVSLAVASGIAALLAALGCDGGGPPPPTAIVLIVVDTLRADRLAAWGSDRAVTPFLDSWVQSAVVFEQARAAAPWTLPSFASLLTGVYPARHGAHLVAPKGMRSYANVDERLPLLAEVLRDAGWDTAAFVTNRFLGKRWKLRRGFRRYRQMQRPGPLPHADASVDSALTWLDREAESPFFLVVHVLDPHMPYDPPAETRGRFTSTYSGGMELPVEGMQSIRRGNIATSEADRTFIQDAYDEAVAFVDEQLGRLLDEFDQRGVLDHALVVLTADHGEEFWDHGGFEHGHTMYDELLRVPLAVWMPGVKPRRVSGPVSLVDLMPTILDAAGATAPDSLEGVSLWPVITKHRAPPERRLFAEFALYDPGTWAVLEWPWKLLVDVGEGRTELYDIASDPKETRDVSDEYTDLVHRLIETGAARFEPSADPDEPAAEFDDETLETLRSLGYVD